MCLSHERQQQNDDVRFWKESVELSESSQSCDIINLSAGLVSLTQQQTHQLSVSLCCEQLPQQGRAAASMPQQLLNGYCTQWAIVPDLAAKTGMHAPHGIGSPTW